MNSMDPTNIVCNVIEGLSVISNPCATVAPGAFIEAYFPQNASICNYASILQSYGVAYNLKCCNQDNCNSPYFTSATVTAATPLSTLAIASVTSVNASVEAFVATTAPWSTPPSSSPLLCYVSVGGAAQLTTNAPGWTQPSARPASDARRSAKFMLTLWTQIFTALVEAWSLKPPRRRMLNHQIWLMIVVSWAVMIAAPRPTSLVSTARPRSPSRKHDLVLLLCSHLHRSPSMMTFCLVIFTYSVSSCKHAPSLPLLRCAVLCFWSHCSSEYLRVVFAEAQWPSTSLQYRSWFLLAGIQYHLRPHPKLLSTAGQSYGEWDSGFYHFEIALNRTKKII